LETGLKTKWYCLPSKKFVPLQGYEPQFLNYFFNILKRKEEDLDFNIPTFSYKYRIDRTYYPDLYIPKENLIVEVKSYHTLNDEINGVNMREKNFYKHKAVKQVGYNHCFMVMNQKGELLERIDDLTLE